MRKFLVKHFVLNYNIFGYNAPRASRIIFPLMILNGIFWDYKKPTIFNVSLLVLLVIALFFGFIYFRFYPAQYNELDNEQKEQYNIFHNDNSR